ncbi:TetR/AcrR family transcriptional regulator [Streptosporangium carneum]|uniref:TetR family transcriptional regulator n=1 Tax=Streptosporangium carneum TaxID=47481 RepID=A0A9W6MGP8_9ACTN|nr:helix-turn-helix domain-containing protein [Streptosporangium carneum]GLK13377.1 TetR family transcriptional regulator [Streptosporangium carneum]
MSPAEAPRRMRADARRNYERLLAEAEAVFAEQGTEASLELVARRAGVAIGTLYGHFPTRHALLEALMRGHVEALETGARELLDHPSPQEALTVWARAAMRRTASYQGLAASLMSGFETEESALHSACRSVVSAGGLLLERARRAGAVRADVSASDLFALISALAWTSEQVPQDQAERLLSFTLDGLRPVTDRHVTGPHGG